MSKTSDMADVDPSHSTSPSGESDEVMNSEKTEVMATTKRKRDVEEDSEECDITKKLCKGEENDLPVDEDSQSSGTIPDLDVIKDHEEVEDRADAAKDEQNDCARESQNTEAKADSDIDDSSSCKADSAVNKKDNKETLQPEELEKKGGDQEVCSTDTENESLEEAKDKDSSSKMDKSSVLDEDAMNLSQKSADSDKENIDCPMDLSTKATNSPDVIMLSDEDEDGAPKINGHITVLNGDLAPEKFKEHRNIVRRLREDLRNEEAKLVLLKKIRQSQMMQHLTENSQSANKQPSSRQPYSAPPPLVRGGQPSAHSKSSNLPPQLIPRNISSQSSHMRSSSQGPPPLVMAPRQQQNSSHTSIRGTQNDRQPPSLIPGYRQVQSQQQQAAPQPPQQPEQTPAQRQAAAKLALRKQLEKTLLQIPPPKPPPPEMNFIPSLLGNEFILLVGLEEVVKFITDVDARTKGDKSMEVKYVFNPFVCVQCGTDFTPVWKRDKPGSKSVICEQCVTTNQKKALKQEHTNRLKSAFVKALQQEQEIEQRMQQSVSQGGSSSNNASNNSNSTSSGGGGSSGNSSSHNNHSSHANHSSHSSHASHHPMAGIPGAAVTSPMNLSTMKPTTEQIRQHQNLIQAHQAQLRSAHTLPGLQFAPRGLPFPFTPPNLSASKAADLQRQYLLDMIPPRSMPQGTVLWKS